MTTEWCRCGDMSRCHWVSMFNILMSMSVLGCGGVYSAADCGQQTRPGTTEAGRRQSRWSESWTRTSHSLVHGSCGRARGCEQGGDDILIRTSRTFPWCCLYLYAWHFQSKLVSYLVSSAGEDDTFPTSFQPAREAKASKMVWCLSGKEKLNALTFDMVFYLNF